MAATTWKPHDEHGAPSAQERRRLPDRAYAFPRQRKEPLTDARHVRNAPARFDQVQGVTDADRGLAFANILAAARHYGVEVAERGRRDLGRRTHTPNPSH